MINEKLEENQMVYQQPQTFSTLCFFGPSGFWQKKPYSCAFFFSPCKIGYQLSKLPLKGGSIFDDVAILEKNISQITQQRK